MNSRKKISLVTVGIIVLLLAGFVFIANKNTLPKQIEVNMPDEDRAFYNQSLEDTLGKLEAVGGQDNIPAQEIYRQYIELGVTYNVLGRLADAGDAYRSASNTVPELVPAYAGLYQVYKTAENYKVARKYILKVLELAPGEWNFWRAYIEMERYHFNKPLSEIDRLYRDALGATNFHPNIMNVYAVFLEERGELQAAFNYWKRLKKDDPSGGSTYDREIVRLETLLKN